MSRLENKVVLITGAARGMGAAHTQAFLKEGAKVAFTDILESEGYSLCDSLCDNNARFYPHDVTKLDQWSYIVDCVEKEFGPIDILVNNAGIGSRKSILDMTEEEYRNVIDVNQVSVFLGMKSVLPSMLKTGNGSIVNVSSIAGLQGSASGSVAYDSSKFAVRGMSKSIALEMASNGIRVNSVHPGIIMTPLVMTDEEEPKLKGPISEFLTKIPMGRAARSEEVTKLILFLASDDASYCTGAEFVIDGGVTASRY